jgi:DNA-binding transcriptional LysR family regulator
MPTGFGRASSAFDGNAAGPLFSGRARTLNFTRAAEECNVTQPALTRAIKQLEDEFGGGLIRREGRNSLRTDLGNRMPPPLQQCFESAQSAKMLATRIRKGEIPTLSLAVSRTLEPDLLLAPLEEMRRTFPGLKLKLRLGTGPEIGAHLRNGEVELRWAGRLERLGTG